MQSTCFLKNKISFYIHIRHTLNSNRSHSTWPSLYHASESSQHKAELWTPLQGHKIQTFSRENQYCVSLYISDLTTSINTIIPLFSKRNMAVTKWILTHFHQGWAGAIPWPQAWIPTGTAPTTHTQTWESCSLMPLSWHHQVRIQLPRKPVFIRTAHPYAVVIATQFPAWWSSNWTLSLEKRGALCLGDHLRIQFQGERTVQIMSNISEHFKTFFNTKAKKVH